jgi:hypothetical protein
LFRREKDAAEQHMGFARAVHYKRGPKDEAGSDKDEAFLAGGKDAKRSKAVALRAE